MSPEERRNMRRQQIEQFLASRMPVEEWTGLNHVSPFRVLPVAAEVPTGGPGGNYEGRLIVLDSPRNGWLSVLGGLTTQLDRSLLDR